MKIQGRLFRKYVRAFVGVIGGMRVRLQLYTVPGQVFYNETRKLVLKGVDGIVFVADSQETMLGANTESFKNLEDNLKALRVGGIFVNFGLVGGMKATLNIRELFFRQHQLRGSFMGSEAMKALAAATNSTR